VKVPLFPVAVMLLMLCCVVEVKNTDSDAPHYTRIYIAYIGTAESC
jgi:hypothetical protein